MVRGLPLAVILINKNKPEKRKKKMFFVNASEEFEARKRQNRLRDKDIEKISGAVKSFKDVDKYCRVVSLDEIAENDYNLNISRYVDTTPEEDEIDLKAAIRKLRDIEAKRKDVEKKMNGYLKELGYDG